MSEAGLLNHVHPPMSMCLKQLLFSAKIPSKVRSGQEVWDINKISEVGVRYELKTRDLIHPISNHLFLFHFPHRL